jgi:hypothetical protein
VRVEAFLVLLLVGTVALAQSKAPVAGNTRSAGQRLLDQSASDGKFTFIVFYRSDDATTQAMIKVARSAAARRSDKVAVALVQIGDPAEKALVDRFDVARSPMPLLLAVAPNLAVTGVFPRELKEEQLDAAIVTPTMTRCMKSLQEGKLVFVCLQTAERSPAPPVVKALQSDPDFAARVSVYSLQLTDPEEVRFLQQMQIDPRQVRTSIAALLAPPGVLIGKYDASATKAEVTTALHHAGKCCDDPNCKHNHGATTQQPAGSRRK